MLVLTRKSNQSIMIGDDIEVTVLSVMGEKVRLGIQAPRDIPVFRTEVYLEIQEERASGTCVSLVTCTGSGIAMARKCARIASSMSTRSSGSKTSQSGSGTSPSTTGSSSLMTPPSPRGPLSTKTTRAMRSGRASATAQAIAPPPL